MAASEHEDVIHLDFQSLNNPNSDLYIRAHERVKYFVENKLQTSRIAELKYDIVYDMEKTNEDDLVQQLSSNCFNTTVKKFFKFRNDKCELCESLRTINNHLHRCHCNYNNCTRPILCRRALKKCKEESSNNKVKFKDIAHEFIRLHGESPLYMLCSSCHRIYDKNTFNEPKDYGGFSDESDESDESNESDDEVKPLIINKFKTQQDAKKYYDEHLKNIIINESNGKTKRGPNTRKQNSDGYYTAQIKKQRKVWSCDEIQSGVYRGAANNDYWFYPCYQDISDKTTLQWWLIHKDKTDIINSTILFK